MSRWTTSPTRFCSSRRPTGADVFAVTRAKCELHYRQTQTIAHRLSSFRSRMDNCDRPVQPPAPDFSHVRILGLWQARRADIRPDGQAGRAHRVLLIAASVAGVAAHSGGLMLSFSSQRSSPHSHSYTRTIRARRTSEIIAARRTQPLHFGQWGAAVGAGSSRGSPWKHSPIVRSVAKTI